MKKKKKKKKKKKTPCFFGAFSALLMPRAPPKQGKARVGAFQGQGVLLSQRF